MKVDFLTAARAAAAGMLLAVPAALANTILAAQEERSALWSLLTLVVLALGFGLAGFVAGRTATRERARHAAVASFIVFDIVQVIAILGRLDRGADISIPSIVFTAFLAAAMGVGGGALGARRPDSLNQL